MGLTRRRRSCVVGGCLPPPTWRNLLGKLEARRVNNMAGPLNHNTQKPHKTTQYSPLTTQLHTGHEHVYIAWPGDWTGALPACLLCFPACTKLLYHTSIIIILIHPWVSSFLLRLPQCHPPTPRHITRPPCPTAPHTHLHHRLPSSAHMSSGPRPLSAPQKKDAASHRTNTHPPLPSSLPPSLPPSPPPPQDPSALPGRRRLMILPPAPHREATAWSVWSLAAGLLIVGKEGGRMEGRGGEGREIVGKREASLEGGMEGRGAYCW